MEDFKDEILDKVNSWVKEKTGGMIPMILDSVSPYDRMYLLNAVAFDSEWMSGYERNDVKEEEFTVYSGQKRKIKMMHSTEKVYLEDENAKGFLKFYKDSRFSFAALLPDESMDIREYVSSLNGDRIIRILQNARSIDIRTGMPVFTSESSVDMKTELQSMGMSEAFTERADFSKAGKIPEGMRKMYIDKILQKTYVKVNERGTKAVAVTMLGFCDSVCIQMLSEEVILNRPFVYMIIDHANSIPVFMGVLMDVTE